MPESNELTPEPELSALAFALRELAPSAGALSRDRLLFEAGRTAALPAYRLVWPVAAGGFALLSVVFGGLLALQEPQVVIVDRPIRIEVPVAVRVEVPVPAAEPSPAPAAPAALARSAEDEHLADTRRLVALRRDVLRWGAEILPEPRAGRAAPALHDPEIEEWLRPVPGTFASPYAFPFSSLDVNRR